MASRSPLLNLKDYEDFNQHHGLAIAAVLVPAVLRKPAG